MCNSTVIYLKNTTTKELLNMILIIHLFLLNLGELGRYATTSPVHPISGRIIHVQGEDGTNHGCTIPVNNPPNGKPWVALIQRGECKFREKIINSAVFNNATAVVIYNHLDEDKLITMTHQSK